MFTLINLDYPLQSAIVLYIIIILIVFIFRPKLIKENKNKYILPIIIIVISIFSYFLFATTQWFNS